MCAVNTEISMENMCMISTETPITKHQNLRD